VPEIAHVAVQHRWPQGARRQLWPRYETATIHPAVLNFSAWARACRFSARVRSGVSVSVFPWMRNRNVPALILTVVEVSSR